MIEVLAPAKLNLGLEILSRRDDGFHEIRTVMTPVSLIDRLVFDQHGQDRLNVGGRPVEAAGNIVCAAISLAMTTWGLGAVNATLTKRIPIASGLGGGSSDAAATLMALAHIAGQKDARLNQMAARLGSDVPFFLTGTTTVVAGRGDVVSALPAHEPLFPVIVAPRVSIAGKTATLYSLLSADDFTDGTDIDSIQSHIAMLGERRDRLPNAFQRALYALVPNLDDLARMVERTTSLPANLTGAGPAHYVLCNDAEHAASTSRTLRGALAGRGAAIFAVRSMTGTHIREVAGGKRDA